jgi:hypothetical protein
VAEEGCGSTKGQASAPTHWVVSKKGTGKRTSIDFSQLLHFDMDQYLLDLESMGVK